MERIKVAENFYLDEFVDPHTYFNRVDNGLDLIDERLFAIAQQLRVCYGKPIGINNWWKKFEELQQTKSIDEIIEIIENASSIHKWSGYRSERCTIGAAHSAHKLGKAIDPKGNETELFQVVRDNACDFYNLGLRRLEDISITHGWLHMDTLERNTVPNKIRIVDLTSHIDDITIEGHAT